MTSPEHTRALILDAYDAQSHRRWREGLVRVLPDLDWRAIALPARHFAWRARSNAVTFAFDDRIAQALPPDLLIATSTVDLAGLRGLEPRVGDAARTILYVHENQFAYPWRPEAQHNALHLQLQEVWAALCADHVVFNSTYNMSSFLEGARALQARVPDGFPAEAIDQIERRSCVIGVGLDEDLFKAAARARRGPSQPVHLLWNHRWEYDKAPDRVFGALELLVEQGLGDRFRVHIVGQRFRDAPEAFARARQTLADQIETWGYLDSRAAYEDLLRRCDVVLSAALHDFQGLSVMEAMAAGVTPLVPDRLAYCAYVPERWRYPSHPDDAEAERAAIAQALASRLGGEDMSQRAEPTRAVAPWRWSHIGRQWEKLLRTPLPRT